MFAFGRKKEKGLKTEGSVEESKEEKERRKKEKKEAKKAAKQGRFKSFRFLI